VLFWLARLPFLSAHDLAIVLNAADHSGVHRRLRRLAQQGLVAHIVPSSEDLTPQWRSYLTNAGMSHAAQLAGLDPAAFAHDSGASPTPACCAASSVWSNSTANVRLAVVHGFRCLTAQ